MSYQEFEKIKKFEFDKFQKQAMEYVDNNNSVVVSAPTGAGKTLIAEYVIEECVKINKGLVYTAPIKALSNQKYRDFIELYGEERVGIVTGDVSINPHAEILIMTTEIFRNALFDDAIRFKERSWVIFDEIHFIDDFERGTVWEEALMFFPDHMKMLCLSATIPNIHDFVLWIEHIHDFPVKTIIEENRPVPLSHNFTCKGKIINKWNDLKKSYHNSYHKTNYRDVQKYNIFDLIKHIQTNKQLPCIYFVFARRRCEELAYLANKLSFVTKSEKVKLENMWNELIEKYNLKDDRLTKNLTPLIKNGIAYHHAGMLPTLKDAVERLFTSKLIKLIFTTETFALGINMPARTVIFDELRKFYGFKFDNLKTRDYYQMAGRAGRRGMDECGYVYSSINPFRISFEEVKQIVLGKPEAVKSQFNTSYATLLHLYSQFQEDLYDIYSSSLHFHQAGKKQAKQAKLQLREKINLLKQLNYIKENKLTEKGKFAGQMFGYELALGEIFEINLLENLNEQDINIVLAALIFEPRKNAIAPPLMPHIKKLKKTLKQLIRRIYKMEVQKGMFPCIKKPHFHLAPIIQDWGAGANFKTLYQHSNIDEGEIVRYIRMIIQVLRELRHSPYISPDLKGKLKNCIIMLNRDEVDAEKQLRS
jgi:superfamily II RNA helicase